MKDSDLIRICTNEQGESEKNSREKSKYEQAKKSAENSTLNFTPTLHGKFRKPISINKTRYKKFKRFRKLLIHQKPVPDKNIAILLRSERLHDLIRKGSPIPNNIANNIAVRTGFTTAMDLNNHISSNRKIFLVLVEKQIKYFSSPSKKDESPLTRTDSVDLNLYFEHHFGRQ